MKQTIDAVFENGAFKPLDTDALPYAQGQRVKLIVETAVESPEDLLNLATQVYEGLSDEEVAEIERIALERNEFFPNRTVL